MAMSTRTLHEAAALLATNLVDLVQILNVGDPITVGTQVSRVLTPAGQPIPGLVQTISLESAVEGRVTQAISVKVAQGTAITAGQAVRVEACLQEPDLVGKVFLLDTISQNGLSLIRKGTATRMNTVNQEGKEGLA